MCQVIVDSRMVNRCVDGVFRKANKVLTDFTIENRQHNGWIEVSRQPDSISLIVHLKGPNGKIFLEKLTQKFEEIFPKLTIVFSNQNGEDKFTYIIK